jgi:Putative prokaryotic signal transducing protein
VRKGVSTVHLGQYTNEHANEIAGLLEKAGIAWWFKQPGYFSSIWEKGTRLFVDETRLDEARAIAERVLGGEPGSSES